MPASPCSAFIRSAFDILPGVDAGGGIVADVSGITAGDGAVGNGAVGIGADGAGAGAGAVGAVSAVGIGADGAGAGDDAGVAGDTALSAGSNPPATSSATRFDRV